jgi:Ca2+-transporting ATPase
LRLAAIQFWSPLSGILLLAAVLAFRLGDLAGGGVILAIVLLNATFGFLLEYRANSALRRLADLHPPQAIALRSGERCVVAPSEVVPGDVLLLEAGDSVPADVRLLESFGLQCAEAILTGEAAPVQKEADAVLAVDVPLAERLTMAFAGTSVAAGRARAVVVATGMDTEVGKIAYLLESTPAEHSPGLREVGQLSRIMLFAAGALVPVVLGVGWMRGQTDLYGSLWMGVSLAVAALPEGLQTVLMAALAFGAHRLALQKAVVRRLGALETLGCVDLVCMDKTGTLTEGRMSVVTIRTARLDVMEVLSSTAETSPSGHLPVPESPLAAAAGEDPPLALSDAARLKVSEAIAGACTAEPLQKDGHLDWTGDPTEAALLLAARSFLPDDLRLQPFAVGRIQREIPFDSTRRRRTILRLTAGGRASVYMTGAPEEVIERCSYEWIPEGVCTMDAERRRWWHEENTRLAGSSLRVVASAYRPFEGSGGVEADELETNLILLGLVGLRDAVRPDAADALRRAAALGVRVVMLTGDQPQTAAAVARELGFEGASSVFSGKELGKWNEAELAARVEGIRLFARVTPRDKLRIVEAWKGRGAVVAMIGDGVNDAPALRAADVGVAMGGGGTHVTKEAGDLVLLDDRLGTLMEALAQGRRVRTSVGCSLEYLLTGNMGEVLLIGVGLLVSGVTALTPLQLLWINLVTDGLPALFLAIPVMGSGSSLDGREPPLVELTSRRFWCRVVVFGCCAAACAGLAYARGNALGGVPMGKAYAFGAVVFEQLLRSVVMGLKGLATGGGGGGALWGVTATAFGGVATQTALMCNEWAASILGGTPLHLIQIGEAFLFGAAAVFLGQSLIAFQRNRA